MIFLGLLKEHPKWVIGQILVPLWLRRQDVPMQSIQRAGLTEKSLNLCLVNKLRIHRPHNAGLSTG